LKTVLGERYILKVLKNRRKKKASKILGIDRVTLSEILEEEGL